MSKRFSVHRVMALVMILALLLAACGNEDARDDDADVVETPAVEVANFVDALERELDDVDTVDELRGAIRTALDDVGLSEAEINAFMAEIEDDLDRLSDENVEEVVGDIKDFLDGDEDQDDLALALARYDVPVAGASPTVFNSGDCELEGHTVNKQASDSQQACVFVEEDEEVVFDVDDCELVDHTVNKEASDAAQACVFVAIVEDDEDDATPPVVETPDLSGDTCSNKGVRADHDPAVSPQGITFNDGDQKGSYIMHVWSNFRDPNLNPMNFPPADGAKTNQHEFILWVKYGEKVTLPPGTGGSIWRYDCDAMGWADYNREREIEGFYPITVDQIWAYYETGNPWGSTPEATTAPTETSQDDSCSLSGAEVVDHPAMKGQTWTLPGNKSWVIHLWSNQHDPNLDTRHFGGHSGSVPAEFIYLTSIQTDGKDVVLPVGTGGKAWGYDCDSAGKTDYEDQIAAEGFVPITWDQLQNYARTGDID